MNIYFLVEGKRTEKKVYPRWIKCLIPQLQQVQAVDAITHNTYYIFSSHGYPSILQHIQEAVENINSIGSYDYFVICIDADDVSVEERFREIEESIKMTDIAATPVITVQNRCIETWFLGNRKLCAVAPNNHPFIEYKRFYDVSKDDPELMEKPQNFRASVSQFHAEYLKHMLREKRLKYSKREIQVVCQEDYVRELQKRVHETQHLQTLRAFFQFCETLHNKIE